MSEDPQGGRPVRTVAVLGVGVMGGGMARNLAAAGLDVRVWNRSRDKAEAFADVATVCATPAEAVQDVDAVLTMLWGAQSVAEVMDQAGSGLAEGTLWVQASTVGVEGAKELAQVAAKHSLVYLDSPVLGTKKPAEDGTLVVLASGPQEALERCAPVFEAIGSRTLVVGEAGTGSALKLACNAWVLTTVEGVAESLTLARSLGVDPALFLQALKGGATDSGYLQLKGSAMLGGDFTPSFNLAGGAKDAGLIMDAAAGAGLDLAVLDAVRRHVAAAVEQGNGDLDLAAAYLTHQES